MGPVSFLPGFADAFNFKIAEFSQVLQQDEAIVKILCEWAVSWQRYGEHRAVAVAKLLEKRQNDLLASSEDMNSGPNDDKDSVSSLPPGPPTFQSMLMSFLDVDAPVLGWHF